MKIRMEQRKAKPAMPRNLDGKHRRQTWLHKSTEISGVARFLD